MIGRESSRHPLHQSGTKPKPIANWSRPFCRASEIAFLISQCLLVTLAFPLLGCCDYWDCFGLCFARFSWKTKGQEDNKRYTKVHAESKNSFNQNDDFEPLLLHLLTSLLDLKLLNTMWLSGLIFFVTIRIARIAWPIQNRRSSLL